MSYKDEIGDGEFMITLRIEGCFVKSPKHLSVLTSLAWSQMAHYNPDWGSVIQRYFAEEWPGSRMLVIGTWDDGATLTLDVSHPENGDITTIELHEYDDYSGGVCILYSAQEPNVFSAMSAVCEAPYSRADVVRCLDDFATELGAQDITPKLVKYPHGNPLVNGCTCEGCERERKALGAVEGAN